MDFPTINILYAFLAFIIGCLAAFAELLSRYNDPLQIVKIHASQMYILINGITSIGAYYFLFEFDILKDNETGRILLAGTSALVILRSSLASIKIGEKDIDAGPAVILQVFLNWADRAFDQKRSKIELSSIKQVMNKVDFDKAKLALPTTCFTIMKNLSQDEQDKISGEVEELSKSDLDNQTKSINLGIVLSHITGIDLLERAVNVLGDSVSYKEDEKSDLDRLIEIQERLTKTSE